MRCYKYLYGRRRVSSVRRYVPEQTTPKSPEQQRIQSLPQQAKQYRATAQQERAKLVMKKARQPKTTIVKPLKPIKPISAG
jgi:hypothetical protein